MELDETDPPRVLKRDEKENWPPGFPETAALPRLSKTLLIDTLEDAETVTVNGHNQDRTTFAPPDTRRSAISSRKDDDELV
jgi:hypothetical protein